MNFLLRLAAIATLVALALMVWSVLQPDVIPIMVAMSVAQGLGTLAFGTYGYVVFRDLMKKRKANRDSRANLEFPPKKVQRELAKPEPETDGAGGNGVPEPAAATNPSADAGNATKEMPEPAAPGASTDRATTAAGDVP